MKLQCESKTPGTLPRLVDFPEVSTTSGHNMQGGNGHFIIACLSHAAGTYHSISTPRCVRVLNRTPDAVPVPVKRPVAEGLEDTSRAQQPQAVVHSHAMQAEALAAWFPQPKPNSASDQTQPGPSTAAAFNQVSLSVIVNTGWKCSPCICRAMAVCIVPEQSCHFSSLAGLQKHDEGLHQSRAFWLMHNHLHSHMLQRSNATMYS